MKINTLKYILKEFRQISTILKSRQSKRIDVVNRIRKIQQISDEISIELNKK